MDNDTDFYLGTLVDDLLYYKSSVCEGSMTIYYLTVLPGSGVAQQLVEEYCSYIHSKNIYKYGIIQNSVFT